MFLFQELCEHTQMGRERMEELRSVRSQGMGELADAMPGEDRRIQKEPLEVGLEVPNPIPHPGTIDEEIVAELSKTVAGAVARPTPVTPVLNELEDVRGLIHEKPQGLPGRAAGADDGRAKPLCIVGAQSAVICPNHLFR